MPKNNLIIISLLSLSACATQEPLVRVVTQKVEIPIPVACVTPLPIKPEYNVPKLTIDHNMFEKTKAYIADEQLRKGYEKELLVALNSCRQDNVK